MEQSRCFQVDQYIRLIYTTMCDNQSSIVAAYRPYCLIYLDSETNSANILELRKRWRSLEAKVNETFSDEKIIK